MKVLIIIDHAPDYRESFFRQLADKVDLTVVAQPCESDGLFPPIQRIGYNYIEEPSKRAFGFFWQAGLLRIILQEDWSIICVDLNLRHIARALAFIRSKPLWSKWVWWGHIFGKNSSLFFDQSRQFFLTRGANCLTYSEEIAQTVKDRYGVPAVSVNNTQICLKDFKFFQHNKHSDIRLIFVGRYQTRKRLERLVDLCKRRSDVSVRLVGPGMAQLDIPEILIKTGKIQIFPRLIGEKLEPHFEWADLVAAPGHVGLLVMNAAQHGRGIVIDSQAMHAPEYFMAKEAKQPFIAFGKQNEVDQFIDEIKKNREKIQHWGQCLQTLAKQKYTVEAMADAHVGVFNAVCNPPAQ